MLLKQLSHQQIKTVQTVDHIIFRSPFGFWIFCIVACLAAAIIVKSVQVYLAHRNSEPAAVTSLFDVLNHDNKPSSGVQ